MLVRTLLEKKKSKKGANLGTNVVYARIVKQLKAKAERFDRRAKQRMANPDPWQTSNRRIRHRGPLQMLPSAAGGCQRKERESFSLQLRIDHRDHGLAADLLQRDEWIAASVRGRQSIRAGDLDSQRHVRSWVVPPDTNTRSDRSVSSFGWQPHLIAAAE